MCAKKNEPAGLEKPFFFENDGLRLFGILHVPTGEGRLYPRGVVFCHPFAEEKTISHRVMTGLARFFCRLGYHVLRFDYRGCGDSEGEFEEANLTTRTEDIKKAILILQQASNAPKVTLLGLRLGATLAALVATKDPGVESLILWEPIVNVRAYFLQFLRMQVMADNLLEGRISKTRESMLRTLKDGNSVEILCFMLSPKCFEEFTAVDMLIQVSGFQGSTLIVNMSRQKRNRKDLQALFQAYSETDRPVQMLEVPERPFWIDHNNPWQEMASWFGHEAIFQQTAHWLNNLQESL